MSGFPLPRIADVKTPTADTHRKMHELDVGRIFWKEWRAQWSFWIGLFGLALGLEIIVVLLLPLWNHMGRLDLLRLYQGLVIVLACAFATGSSAIAFAGEVESKTKGLLQRIPVKPRDLIAGKLSLAIVASYVLFFAMRLCGGLMLAISFGHSEGTVARENVDMQAAARTLGMSGLFPLFFVAVGTLFSLILGDVLLTVVAAGLASVALLAIPDLQKSLPLQTAIIAIALVGDYLLIRRWLRVSSTARWTAILPRLRLPEVSWPHDRIQPRPVVAASLHLLDRARSPVAWRRAAGTLIWKEFRQAASFCLMLFVAGLLLLGIVPLTNRADWSRGAGFISLLLITFAPLLPGVAAVQAERRNNSFRQLADRGTAPDAFWIAKQTVWLSLTLLTFVLVLLADRVILSDLSHPDRVDSIWNAAARTATVTSGFPSTSVGAPLSIAGFHVLLLYSLGYLLALLLPSPVTAPFSGALIGLGLDFAWAFVNFLRIPFWWTIGLLPFIFLAASWIRTGDWLIGRNSLRAWSKVAAVFVVPLVGIAIATCVYRVIEIPAVEVPKEVLAANVVLSGRSLAPATQSLFVEAMDTIVGDPPTKVWDADRKTVAEGWQYAMPGDKAWVARNASAVSLALRAALRAPGSFPTETMDPQAMGNAKFSFDRKAWSLAQLLLYSGRQRESDNKFDEALSCYAAVARLGNDFAKSGAGFAVSGRSLTLVSLSFLPGWGAHPEQSTERVLRAIREFQGFMQEIPLTSTTVLRTWQADRMFLRKRIWGHSPADRSKQTVAELRWIRWLLPWELVRVERLADACFAALLSEVRLVESDIEKQRFVPMTDERIARWSRSSGVPWKFEQTTFDAPTLQLWTFRREPEFEVDQIARMRMDLIALAAADFARVHHKRPKSLGDLVPVYFRQLPVDPWTGRDFNYEPTGLSAVVSFDHEELKPQTPFLSSAGMYDSRLVAHATDQNGKRSFQVVSRFEQKGFSQRPGGSAIVSAPMVRLP